MEHKWSNFQHVAQMLTLLFRYEPMQEQADSMRKFTSVVCSWGTMKRSEKLGEIFGVRIMSSVIMSQNNMVFEIKLTEPDTLWVPSTISSEDLAIALDLDPSEWSIWRPL